MSSEDIAAAATRSSDAVGSCDAMDDSLPGCSSDADDVETLRKQESGFTDKMETHIMCRTEGTEEPAHDAEAPQGDRGVLDAIEDIVAMQGTRRHGDDSIQTVDITVDSGAAEVLVQPIFVAVHTIRSSAG